MFSILTAGSTRIRTIARMYHRTPGNDTYALEINGFFVRGLLHTYLISVDELGTSIYKGEKNTIDLLFFQGEYLC